jgi:hypothetical protein
MIAVAVGLLLLAIAGWLLALAGIRARRQHVCPIEQPDKAVLVNAAGLPESLRTLRGKPPVTYSRPKGKGPAILYHRIGTAVVYQPKS